jgi:cell division septal protein FtsQ
VTKVEPQRRTRLVRIQSEARQTKYVHRPHHGRTYSYNVSSAAPRVHSRTAQISTSRALAGMLALSMVALLAWFFLDTRYFFVYQADVQGNSLLSAEDIYKASGLNQYSIFYVDRAAVAEHIRGLNPGIKAVRVESQWPNQVSIRVREQDVQFIWRCNGGSYLVDGMGRVLRADDGSHPELIIICDLGECSLKVGDHVERVALNAASGLHSLIPTAMVFDYSVDKGISWVDEHGVRVYLGDDQSLTDKVACMRALLQQIEKSGPLGGVEFVDVRYADSPYYR